MNSERWEAVQGLFRHALELRPSERSHWLDEACADDEELLAEVTSLLEADELASDLLRETAAPATDDALLSGCQLGAYRLEGRLGVGGTSTVFLGIRVDDTPSSEPGAPALPARAAVKVLRAGSEAPMIERFATELEVLARLDHPGIARLVDAGSTPDGRPYVTTELVDGQTIDLYCAQRRLSLVERIGLVRKVCDAVHHAHRSLVMHRDLKPSNILVNKEGEPILLDFGLAKLLPSPLVASGAEPTASNARMLTPSCASPEQIRGEPLTTATDVYSLGVLLYELLAEHHPYAPYMRSPTDLARAICEVDPPPPSRATLSGQGGARPARRARALRGDLDHIVLMALRKEPERRYASVEQLAADLDRYLSGQPVRARRAGVLYRTGKLLHRHREAVAAALVLTVGLAVFAGSTLVQKRRTAEERDKARQSLTFLVEVLRSADPTQALGKTVTVREILDLGADRILSDLGGQPFAQAELLDTVGKVYLELGVLDRAETLLVKGLSLRRDLLATPHLDLASSLTNLGHLRSEQGRHEDAEALLRQALDHTERLLGARHLAVAASRHNLADSLRDQGEFEPAQALYEQALARRIEQFGPIHLDVAETRNNLGVLFHMMGDLDEAESHYREALEVRSRILGEEHPDVALSLGNLAVILGRRDALDEAIRLTEEANDMTRRLLGERHLDVAIGLQNLAMLQLRLHEFEKAEENLLEAMAIELEINGPEHPDRATKLHHLGLLHYEQDQLELAESRFRESAALYQRTLRDDHPWVAHPLLGLGTVLIAQGRPRAALGAIEESLEIRLGTYGSDHWRVAQTESVLATVLASLGRGEEAERLFRTSIPILEAELGADSSIAREARLRWNKASGEAEALATASSAA